jgi:hypothetical protein
MAQPSRSFPHRKTLRLIGTIFSINLLLVILSLVLVAMPASAQQTTPLPPPDNDKILYDPLPVANSPGALRYVLADSWDHTDLTYSFDNCPSSIDCDQAWAAVRAAFQTWQNVSALSFTETEGRADIDVQWSTQDPLGYPGDVLAFAYLPSDGGDLYIDDAEQWHIGDYSPEDLILVAAHEIGHAVGLDHSSDPNALMYPVATGTITGLGQDDVAAIQALYGPPDGNRPDQNIPQAPAPTGGEQASGTITDDNPYEIWDIDALAGETITVTMTRASGDLDPYIGLMDVDLQDLYAEAGDEDGDGQAVLTYTFSEDGAYTLVTTRYGTDEGNTEGDYDLNVQFSEPGGGGTTANNPSGAVEVTIVNSGFTSLCELYFSPSEEDDWGDNLIGDEMRALTSIVLDVPPGTYDLLVYDCEGNEYLEEYTIGVTGATEIDVYQDSIDVIP